MAGLAAPLLICNDDPRFIGAEQMHQISVEPAAILMAPIGHNTAPAVAPLGPDSADVEFLRLEREAFAGFPNMAIDVAVMEKSDRGGKSCDGISEGDR